MRDEEMAEEYVKKEGFRSGMFGELDNITSSKANKEIKQAFLAGLKAGRPQWHNLKKDPNDLPKSPKLSVIGILKDGKFATGHSLIECYYSKECGWSDCYGNSLYREVEYWAEGNFPKK